MVESVDDDVVAELRRRVRAGESRYEVAEELDVAVKTVYKYTDDLEKERSKVTDEERARIYHRFHEGATAPELAKRYPVCESTIYRISREHDDHRDVDVNLDAGDDEGGAGLDEDHRRGLGPGSIKLLSQLVSQGYLLPDDNVRVRKWYKQLKKYDFAVERAEVNGTPVYYLEKHREEACQAYVREHINDAVMDVQELTTIQRCFGLEDKNSNQFLGNILQADRETQQGAGSKESDGDGLQTEIDDFVGTFLHA